MMKKSFHECSYLSQVRILRNLAKTALTRFPVKVNSIQFINHGENTTFRVFTSKSSSYLLRIHRNDYHSKSAIEEEIKWLSHLSRKGLSVPRPLKSLSGHWVENVSDPKMQATRNCSVFQWLPGSFIKKSLHPKHMFETGQLLAAFQNNTPKSRTKHRNYWTAEGLVGLNAKFGSLDQLQGVSKKEQLLLTQARKSVLKKLKRFQEKFPGRMGLIHADLHFGNLISTEKGLSAIDFDDCGYGFFAYDLVVPMISAQVLLGEKKKHRLPEYKKALIEGYKTKRSWDKDDDKIFTELYTARRLMTLGWLNSRMDNPKLRKYLKTSVQKAIEHIKSRGNEKFP